MYDLPTVEIHNPDNAAYKLIINEADYDPKVHQVWKPDTSPDTESPDTEPVTSPGNLDGISVAEARPLIKGQLDSGLLQYWLDCEKGGDSPRRGIVEAINDQLKELKEIAAM